MTTEQKFKASMREVADKIAAQLWALVEKQSEKLAAQALATAKASLRGLLEGASHADRQDDVDVDEEEEREDRAPARRALPPGPGRPEVRARDRGGRGSADRVDLVRARASKADPGKPSCSKCGKAGHNARTCGRAAEPAPDSEDDEGGQLFPPALLAPPGGVNELAQAFSDVAHRRAGREPSADPEEERSAPPPSPRLQAPPLPEIRHRVLSPPSLHVPPPGWTVEFDRREELTALSELTLNRKC